MASLLVAADPILLHHSTLVMTETLATFLATVVLYSLIRFSARPDMWNAGLAGGSLALAALCRPVFFVTMAVAGCFMLLARSNLPTTLRKRWTPRLLNIGSFAIIAGIVLSPWVIRNWLVFDRLIVATTHGGYTFQLGNNESFYSYLRDASWGSTWRVEDFESHEKVHFSDRIRPWMDTPLPLFLVAMGWSSPEDEIIAGRLHYEQSFKSIRNEPGMFAYACLIRNGRLWQLVPHRLDETETTARRWMRYMVGVWYAGLFALAAIGCWTLWKARRARKYRNGSDKEDKESESETIKTNAHSGPLAPWIWGFLMIASFTLVHTFYWRIMRMWSPRKKLFLAHYKVTTQ